MRAEGNAKVKSNLKSLASFVQALLYDYFLQKVPVVNTNFDSRNDGLRTQLHSQVETAPFFQTCD